MAAGDVVLTCDCRVAGLRFLGGTVTLDGTNPTPIQLSAYVSSVLMAQATMQGSTTPGDDPDGQPTLVITGTLLDLYAWKNTSGTDPTLVASTDNARLFYWFAIGIDLPRKGS